MPFSRFVVRPIARQLHKLARTRVARALGVWIASLPWLNEAYRAARRLIWQNRRRRMIAGLTAAAFLVSILIPLFHSKQAQAATWWSPSWSYRRKITFNNSASSTPLQNFPVLVALTSANVDYSNTQDAGQDIRFTDSDGSTPLSYEIENWNESGTSNVWVKVPQIDAGSSTDFIYMYYGNTSAADGQKASDVWSNGYRAVYHMDETSGTALSDSTGNGNIATKKSAGEPAAVTAGPIGTAQDFDGTDDYARAPDSNSLDVTGGGSVSAWVKRDAINTWQSIVDKGNADDSREANYGLEFNPSNTVEMGFGAGGAIGSFVSSATALTSTTTNYYITGTWDGTTVRLYINGTMDAFHSQDVAATANTSVLRIGEYGGAVDYHNGPIDELRVSSVTRSADWTKAEYISGNNTMNTFGAQEAGTFYPEGQWSYRRQIIFNNAPSTTNLANFPVRVSLDASKGNVNYYKIQDAGQDVRFVDADGTTQLPYEIERWNKGGASEIWVKVPQIDAGTTTDSIWMYYGNSTVSSGQQAGNVWDANYAGVWHFKEDPSIASTNGILDATANANHGTDNGGMNTSNQISGQVGTALSFDGSNDYVGVPDPANGSLDFGANQDFTISIWINTTDIPSSSKPLGKTNIDTNNVGWGMFQASGNVSFKVTNGASTVYQQSLAGMNDGLWHNAVLSVTRAGNCLLYKDGALITTTSCSSWAATNLSNANALNFGNDSALTSYYNGKLDEPRISRTARSADWVKAEYRTDTDQFNTYGTEEIRSGVTNATTVPWMNAGWSYRRKITLNNGASTTDLVNFPVLVSLVNGQNINYANVQTAGQDLRFTDCDGTTQLAHEIEKWDETAVSTVWVKVPQIDAASAADCIYMYYGNPGASDGQQPANVWDGSSTLVMHLNEAAACSVTFVDSTSPANNGSCNGGGPAPNAAGKIGAARTFTSTSLHYITVPDDSALDPDSSNFSASLWVKLTSTTAFSPLIQHLSDASPFVGYQLYHQNGNLLFSDGNSGDAGPASGITANTWTQVSIVKTGTTVTFYVNGVSKGTATFRASLGNATTPVSIGYDNSGSFNSASMLDGSEDEIRVANTARNADWVQAEYLTDTNQMNTFGSEESRQDAWWNSSWGYRRKITFNNSASSTNLTNFPVRVSLTPALLDYQHVQDAGQDLRFVDADGSTVLSYEIDSWNEGSTSEVWVKVPQIDAASSSDYIYMYYGNAAASPGQSANNTWDSNYNAVWHLKENPAAKTSPNGCDGATKEVCDSTSNGRNGDAINMAAGNSVAAQIAKGFSYTASSSQVADMGTIPQINGASKITISAWMKRQAAGSIVTVSKESSDFQHSTGLEYEGDGTLNFNLGFNGGTYAYTNNNDTNWHFVTLVFDGTQTGNVNRLKGYLDGVQQTLTFVGGTIPATTSTDTTTFKLGESGGGTYTNGSIDETRLANTNRSADWVKAEYLTDTNTMNTIGGQQSVSGPADESSADAWCNDATGVTCTTAWTVRRKVYFINTPAYENNTGFPLAVKLDATNVNYNMTQNSGQDIRFVDPTDNTTVLPHEIEKWDESGTSAVWVKVPQMDANTNTDYIWMYYGNSSVGSPATQLGNNTHATSVWDSNYKMVQHMGQNPTAAAPQYTDSTSNGNNATANNTAASTDAVNGVIDKARQFRADGDIRVNNSASLLPATDITISGWINLTDSSQGANIMYKNHLTTPFESYDLGYEAGTGFEFGYMNNSSSYGKATLAGTPSTNTWYFVTGVRSNNTLTIYVNGSALGTATATTSGTIYNSTDQLVMGNVFETKPTHTNDEERISSVARSASWINADYRSGLNTVNTFGPEEITSPDAPTLTALSNATTLTPTFQMQASDQVNPNYLRYKIDVCSTSDCSVVVRTVDQTASQTGWSGQDSQTSTAYVASATLASSTLASYTYQTPALSAGTQYWWRAYAIDPGDSNSWSPASDISSFTTAGPPTAPVLESPANAQTGVNRAVQLTARAADPNSDAMQYKIDICSTNTCSSIVRTIDQTASQTGWVNQNAASNTAYIGSSLQASSEPAVHIYQSPLLTPSTQYWWRAYAIDPSGSNTWSPASTIGTFTTGGSDVLVQGSTLITGGSRIGL